MNFTLHIWRQKNTNSSGQFVTYNVTDIDSDTSFLEMLDQLNEDLIEKGRTVLYLIMTAGKGFVVLVLWLSMGIHMVRRRPRQRANFT